MNNILQKGLTLTEMLIVVSIAVIFSSMVFANYGTGKDSMALERAGQKLAQDLRRVQEMAMAGSFGSGVNAVGIYFDEANPNVYIIFDDKNANYLYDGSGEKREEISIEAGIKICDIKNNDTPVSNNYISISFAPPEPVTRIENSNTGNNVSIILSPQNDCPAPTKSRIVNINNVGRIEVNNP